MTKLVSVSALLLIPAIVLWRVALVVVENPTNFMANGKTTDQKKTDYGHDNATFCVDWSVDMDAWWTHHPEWFASSENDTHYCFSHMQDSDKALFFRQIYNVQFKSNCWNVTTKEMWSSGWGADFMNIIDGLDYAMKSRQPVQMFVPKGQSWHYAGLKDNSRRPVCPERGLYCYFLNTTSCAPVPKKSVNGFLMSSPLPVSSVEGKWAYEYATRPQTWLRHAVYKYSSYLHLPKGCTAMHVRRSDVVLHGKQSRKYHAIKEYMEQGKKQNMSNNILLLTDDQNAIEEAESQFPDFNWIYLKRPRHRGAEGGWENQTPSNDPKQEVIVILSIFRLVKECDMLIHSTSHFSNHLFLEMKRGTTRINIDSGKQNVRSEKNAVTTNAPKSTN